MSPNPIDMLSDAQLWNSQLLLQITCNRTKYSVAKKRVANLCALGVALRLAADIRGLPSPSAPYNIGKLKDEA